MIFQVPQYGPPKGLQMLKLSFDNKGQGVLWYGNKGLEQETYK